MQRFEVGIREGKTGQMMNREWSRAELEQSAAWLKRMNAKGNDVYIRPAGDHGLVLVDDLKAQTLERMKAEGFTFTWRPGFFRRNSDGWRVRAADWPDGDVSWILDPMAVISPKLAGTCSAKKFERSHVAIPDAD